MCGIAAILRARRKQGAQDSTNTVDMGNESLRRQLLALAKRGPTCLGIVSHLNHYFSSDPARATSHVSYHSSSVQCIKELMAFDPTEENKPVPQVIEEAAAQFDLRSNSDEIVASTSVTLVGSVLHLRGEGHPLRQPHTHDSVSGDGAVAPIASYLCWNGEVFGGTEVIAPSQCDTGAVFAAIQALEIDSKAQSTDPAHTSVCQMFLDKVRTLFESHQFEGPFAMIYYAASLGFTVYGRDPVGRRSLVANWRGYEGNDEVIISSVACVNDESPQAQAADGASSPVVEQPTTANWQPSNNRFAEVPTLGLYGIVAPCTANEYRFEFIASRWTLENRLHPMLTHIPGDYTKDGAVADAPNPSKPTMWTFALPNNKVSSYFPFELRRLLERQEALQQSGTLAAEGRQRVLDAMTRFPMGMVDFAHHIVRSVGYKHSPSVDAPFVAAHLYLTALLDSVSRRVDGSTRRGQGGNSVMVLLSGGIDSTVLAALAHYCLHPSVPIELVNVAFVERCHDIESSLTPDRIASYAAFSEIMDLPDADKRRWKFVEVDVCPHRLARHEKRIMSLVAPRSTVMDHDIGCALWFAGQGVGMEVPCEDILFRAKYFQTAAGQSISNKLVRRTATSNDAKEEAAGQKRAREEPSATEAAPATSSGESTVDRYGALIEVLVNEGFEAVSVPTSDPSSGCSAYPATSPGMASYNYCRADSHHLLPMSVHRAQHGDGQQPSFDEEGNLSSIKGLVPKKIMLATLGKEYGAVLAPTWKEGLGYKKLGYYLSDACRDGIITFGNKGTTSQYVQLAREEDIMSAAKAIATRRHVCASPDAVPYTCTSPVVIMGMGADETLGGYVRHERLAAVSGWKGLGKELQSDFERLWERNLGRDDRVVSDAGREARFPFLDERVLFAVAELGAASPTSICEFAGAYPGEADPERVVGPTGPGVGDKKILRTVARMIGLTNVSSLQKRAVQFGSRIADPKQRGSAERE